MDSNKVYKIHYIQQKLLLDKSNKYYPIINMIIKKYNLEYSTNKNGIFLNISLLDDKIIDIIYNNFVNSEVNTNQKEDIIKEIQPSISIKKNNHKLKKDKLNLDKFDKYLIQLSRINISL